MSGSKLNMNNLDEVKKSLNSRTLQVCVVGIGRIGLPTALSYAKAGLPTIGVDINENNLILSESATLIMPYHKEMDEIREDAAGDSKIGTTRRGIGPAYEDKIGRRSIRVMDLASDKNLEQKLEIALNHHNTIRKGLGKKIFKKETHKIHFKIGKVLHKRINSIDI